MSILHVADHPLIIHKLSIMRKKETGSKDFRELLEEIARLMGYELTRDLPLKDVEIETPVAKTTVQMITGKKLAIVPILRAGLGMESAVKAVVPKSRTGFIGMYRDEETLEPVEYFCKLPKDIEDREVFILDPMLATGGSACDAIDLLKKRGCKNIKFMAIIGAPEGVSKVAETHPDVEIYVSTLDRCLNDKGYILPGLGDAGDRIFGTK